MSNKRKPCPDPKPDCKYAPHCFADTHHEAFPRKSYRSRLEVAYRHVTAVTICRREHDEIHAEWWAKGQVPQKPTAQEMRRAIEKRK